MNDEGNCAAVRAGRCPDCGDEQMIAGPWGGASRNLYCAVCLSAWCAHGIKYGVISVQPVGKITRDVIEWAKRVYHDERWHGSKQR